MIPIHRTERMIQFLAETQDLLCYMKTFVGGEFAGQRLDCIKILGFHYRMLAALYHTHTNHTNNTSWFQLLLSYGNISHISLAFLHVLVWQCLHLATTTNLSVVLLIF